MAGWPPRLEVDKSRDKAMRQPISRADVEASFNNKVRNMAIVRHIGRPIGNTLTPFFFNQGWTANQMTTLRLMLTMVAAILLGFGSPVVVWLSAVVYYLCFITDCIDGNLARLGDDTSYWGKFYDGAADRLFYAIVPFAAGIGLWRQEEIAWPLVAGAAAAIVYTYNDLISNRFQFFRLWMESQSGPASYRPGQLLKTAETWNDSVMTNGFFIAPLCLLVPEMGLYWYFLTTVILQGVCGGLGLLVLLFDAARTLDRKRKSQHAKGVNPREVGRPGLE